jgi:hypothetical protein
MTFLALFLLAQSVLTKEQRLGESIAADIVRSRPPFANEAVSTYLDALAARMIAQNSRPSIRAITSTGDVEPIPLLGNIVLVPHRAFVAVADENEFAGLIAHAVAHTAQTLRVPQGGLIATWTGIHSSPLDPGSFPRGYWGHLGRYEIDADRLGLALADLAGFDASAYRRYIVRAYSGAKPNGPPPALEERLTRIDEWLEGRTFAARQSSIEFLAIADALRRVPSRPSLRNPRQ